MNRKHTEGFTILELLAGIISAAVLAMAMGSMLYYSYKGWQSMQSVAEMQRDGSLAMRTMTGAVRNGSTNMQFSSGQLLLRGTNGNIVWSFTQLGERLVATNSAIGAGRMDLVQKGVVASGFSCTIISNKASIVLSLMNPADNSRMFFSNSVSARN